LITFNTATSRCAIIFTFNSPQSTFACCHWISQ